MQHVMQICVGELLIVIERQMSRYDPVRHNAAQTKAWCGFLRMHSEAVQDVEMQSVRHHSKQLLALVWTHKCGHNAS